MSDPLIPPWEMCKTCGGDHWTKDHPVDLKRDLPMLKWELVRGAVFEQFKVDLNDTLEDVREQERVRILVEVNAIRVDPALDGVMGLGWDAIEQIVRSKVK